MWPNLAEALARAGVKVQPWACVANVAEAKRGIDTIALPLVARPASPAGEYCAFLAEHAADVDLAYLRASTQSVGGHVLLQAALPGRVVMLSALRADGGWEMFPAVEVGFLAKHALTPIAFTCPPEGSAEIPAKTLSALFDVLETLDETIRGIAVEFVESPGGLVAVFGRAIETLDLPVEVVLSLAEMHGGACVQFLCPPTGVVERINGVDAASASPGVVTVEINAKPGDTVRHITSIPARDAVGAVTAEGESSTEARARAEKAAHQIVFVTTPFE